MIPVQWLPSYKWESMADYALRLTDQIDQSEPFVLVCVSFGGMIAMEMNKIIHPKHTFLVSSVTGHHELPFWIRWCSRTTLHQWLPSFLFQSNPYVLTWLFGVKDPSHKRLIHAIAMKSDPAFTHLAIDKILRWRNEVIPVNLTRIHGAKDHLLPPVKHVPSQIIADSGHFVVVEHADEVSARINDILQNLN